MHTWAFLLWKKKEKINPIWNREVSKDSSKSLSANAVGDSRRGRWIWGIKRISLIKILNLCVCVCMLHMSAARIACSLMGVAVLHGSSSLPKVSWDPKNAMKNKQERETDIWLKKLLEVPAPRQPTKISCAGGLPLVTLSHKYPCQSSSTDRECNLLRTRES